MTLSWDEIQGRAVSFSGKWTKRESKERESSQTFISEFLRCFGIDDPLENGIFERSCKKTGDKKGYIDYLSPKKIIIEMKSEGVSLESAYEQVKEYAFHLPIEEMPDLVMVSDFKTIILYHRVTAEKISFKTKDLKKNTKFFANIAGYETTRVYDKQTEVDLKATQKMAVLHDTLKIFGYDGHDLEVYLVRLLFCLFADDTGIFSKDSFYNYIENTKEDGSDLAFHLEKLFDILNMDNNTRKKRSELLSPDLLQFQYINGGLFSTKLSSADFNFKMRQDLLDCCAFDWSKISPAIFGSMFQGIMDEDKRRELGAHYTSEENILKVINPLFMDNLWTEFEKVKGIPQELDDFHDKISNLKFLDPACGCGNFLIITYRELRLLELEILKMKNNSKQRLLDISDLLRINIENFFGIEYEDFPCEIAKVGMWLMAHKMNMLFADEFGSYFARVPLIYSATIVHGNALTIDWEDVVHPDNLNYIIGNPPFVGARLKNAEQKKDLFNVFSNWKNAGELDYVCCWYKKATDFMEKNTFIKTGFVSTNSICQGEQTSVLWKPLQDKGVIINFAYRTFKWNNEAKGKAVVHCIIVGFSFDNNKEKLLISENNEVSHVENINAYLYEGRNYYVFSRSEPLCNIPLIGIGNKPIDGGNYLFTKDEKDIFIKKEPLSKKYFKKWIGADEFLSNTFRYCLYLKNCKPDDLKNMPECLKRVENVIKVRLNSSNKDTRSLAEFPTKFHVENIPTSDYLIIPRVSSENRNYIPMGFITKDVLAGDTTHIIPNMSLYHFAILTSSIHMIWTRMIGGKLESRYRYSKYIVYNNFPWVDNVSQKQKESLEKYASEILSVRESFKDSKLSSLYDYRSMPPELLTAHKKLDKEVLNLYNLSPSLTDLEIVDKLVERYETLLQQL